MKLPEGFTTRKRVKQCSPSGEVVTWEVKILSVAEAMRIPGIVTLFEGGVGSVSQKLYGVQSGDESDDSIDLSGNLGPLLAAYDAMSSIALAAVCGVSIDGETFEPVRLTANRDEEDQERGVLFIGSLEIGTDESGGQMLATILSTALSGLTRAKETASNFRKSPDR